MYSQDSNGNNSSFVQYLVTHSECGEKPIALTKTIYKCLCVLKCVGCVFTVLSLLVFLLLFLCACSLLSRHPFHTYTPSPLPNSKWMKNKWKLVEEIKYKTNYTVQLATKQQPSFFFIFFCVQFV